MDALDTGAAAASSISPPVPAGVKRYGVGYQSVEKNSDFSGSYRFVKIDGRAPTMIEEHAGNYLNFGELTLQKRNPTAYNTVPGTDTTGVNSVFARVATAMTDPANVALLNNLPLFQHPWGNAST